MRDAAARAEPGASDSICAIVVTYKTGAPLHACLRALRASGADEILLVDNGNDAPEDEALRAFAQTHAQARLIWGQGNVGFAAGCNLAARAATSEVLAFVNPDAVLEPGALGQLRAALIAAPPPVIIGGDLRDQVGAPDRGSRRERLTLWRGFVSFTGLSRFARHCPALRDFNHSGPAPTHMIEVGAVSGALLMIRRADFTALGAFDEGYFLHVEDVDLCRRAQDAGWRVLFQPGPHGVHVRSTSSAKPRTIALHKARSFRRYFRKLARGAPARAAAEITGIVLLTLAYLRR